MNLDEEIRKLTFLNGYYIEFETDSDHEYTCYIKDGYYEECISFCVSGEGKTLSESFLNAKSKLINK